jgi:hypothetical protein
MMQRMLMTCSFRYVALAPRRADVGTDYSHRLTQIEKCQLLALKLIGSGATTGSLRGDDDDWGLSPTNRCSACASAAAAACQCTGFLQEHWQLGRRVGLPLPVPEPPPPRAPSYYFQARPTGHGAAELNAERRVRGYGGTTAK